MGDILWGPAEFSPWSPELYALEVPSSVGCVGPSVVAGPTTVVMLVGGAIYWPGWLPGPASCGGYWPTGGQGQVPG